MSAFVTGFPSFMTEMMCRELLLDRDELKVIVLVREKHLPTWQRFYQSLPERHQRRLDAFTGDIVDMDLGLSGGEYNALLDRCTEIYHLAGIYGLGATSRDTYRVNVDGTAEVLRLARECKRLRRFIHFSTAFVSGDRTGVVMEEELEMGQRFRNAFEETRFLAEQRVRRHLDDFPITIVRPALVIGHSQTGEIDRISGPYYLMRAIVTWPTEVPLPLPGRGHAPMNLVPVDYVVAATRQLARDPRASGKTIHLVDPNPLPARSVFDLVADAAGKPRPRGTVNTSLARMLMRVPGLSRISTAPRHFLEVFDQTVLWRSVNALELLRESTITCPPFEQYCDAIVGFISDRAVRKDMGVNP